MIDLAGKVALITGGGGGIGSATALEFARSGTRVAVVDVKHELAQVTVDAIVAAGGEGVAFQADVSDPAQVQGYVADTLKAFGRIDAFFNNAGIEGIIQPITDYPLEMFDRVLAVNLRGMFLGLKYVLPHLLAQKSGSVINTSSNSGLQGAPGLSPYVASKHAIIGLTRSAALEVGKSGVRVNAICPGPINTQMMQSIITQSNPENPAQASDQIVARNPMGRYGQAEEVARVVVFLASNAASYVNGAIWTIDGGRTVV